MPWSKSRINHPAVVTDTSVCPCTKHLYYTYITLFSPQAVPYYARPILLPIDIEPNLPRSVAYRINCRHGFVGASQNRSCNPVVIAKWTHSFRLFPFETIVKMSNFPVWTPKASFLKRSWGPQEILRLANVEFSSVGAYAPWRRELVRTRERKF
jgi:hypothetical protein